MEREYTEKELKGIWSFLVETFKLTEEETAVIHHQGVSMTQELFDAIIDKCDEVGPDMDRLFYSMLKEHPDFTSVRAERILSEIEKNDIPMPSEEQGEIERQKLYARIRAEYGEDAI